MRAARPAIPPMVPPAIAATVFLEVGEDVDVVSPAGCAVELGETLPITGTVLLAVVGVDFEFEVEEVEKEGEEVVVGLLELEVVLVVLVVGANVGVKFTPVYTTCR
jgi:hypothetical protein